MKIGLDIFQMAYEGTGSARYVHKLVAGLLDGEIDLNLFATSLRRYDRLEQFKQNFSNSKRVNYKFYRLPPILFEQLWNKWHVGNFEWFTGAIDIYHSSDWTQAPSKVRKVTTVHDLIPFLYPEYVHPRIRTAHEERWKWIVQEVDRVIVDAECTKQDILQRFNYPEERIVVVPLGVDERFLRVGAIKLGCVIPAEAGIHPGANYQDPSTNNPSARTSQIIINNQLSNGVGSNVAKSPKDIHYLGGSLPLKGDLRARARDDVLEKYNLLYGKYILSVGTMEPRKNLKRLVQAYSKLDAELRREYPLVIVGKKAWAEQLEFPAGCDVRFTGYVEEDELPNLYGGAKLFVMPSWYEGFGLPVLEAMACGTPVLASRVSSMPEVGGETVTYFDTVEDEAVMARNLESGLLSYAVQLLEKAFERAQGMTWKKTVDETVKVYNQLYS